MSRKLPSLELTSERSTIPEFLYSRVKTCQNVFFIDFDCLVPPPPLVPSKNILIIIYFVIFYFPSFLLRSVVARGETPHREDVPTSVIFHFHLAAGLSARGASMSSSSDGRWMFPSEIEKFCRGDNIKVISHVAARDDREQSASSGRISSEISLSHQCFCFPEENACARSQWFRVFVNFQQHHSQTAKISIKSVKRGGKMFHLKERKISIQFFSLRCSTLKSLISFVCGIAFCSGKRRGEVTLTLLEQQQQRALIATVAETIKLPCSIPILLFMLLFPSRVLLVGLFAAEANFSQARSFCCGWMPTFLSFFLLSAPSREKVLFLPKKVFSACLYGESDEEIKKNHRNLILLNCICWCCCVWNENWFLCSKKIKKSLLLRLSVLSHRFLSFYESFRWKSFNLRAIVNRS